MSNSNPIDYFTVGCLRALWSLSPSSVEHHLTTVSIQDAFWKRYNFEVSPDIVQHVIKRMEHLGVAEIVLDPYAETLITTTDNAIANFVENIDNSVISRGWSNDDWLRSAYSNPKLWNDASDLISDFGSMDSVPSSDGFVTVNHNSLDYREVESLILQADEAIRGDNEIQDDEQKSWIRIHVEAGIVLLKRGGPILKSALLALIVEPLKAAIKATANENVKSLISAAISAFLKWFI